MREEGGSKKGQRHEGIVRGIFTWMGRAHARSSLSGKVIELLCRDARIDPHDYLLGDHHGVDFLDGWLLHDENAQALRDFIKEDLHAIIILAGSTLGQIRGQS